MTDPVQPPPNPRKVRAGLAVITVIVLVATVLVVVVDDPVGRAVMLAVALVGVVRAFLLSRSLRRS